MITMETMKAIRLALDALPERLRLAVWLHSCMGFSPGETADILSVPWNLAQGLIGLGMSRLTSSLIRQRAVADRRAVLDVLVLLSSDPAPEHVLARVVVDLAAFSEAGGCRPLSGRGIGCLSPSCRTDRRAVPFSILGQRPTRRSALRPREVQGHLWLGDSRRARLPRPPGESGGRSAKPGNDTALEAGGRR
jgi:hypothetical protein